ncbi:MAG: histidine phosphatase family protein [Gammaproteobacteria bacterium]|nr:histidine phosphatase family protein [Gammaproteobacteria bacterium]
MKVFFIRHGETTGDVEDRYGGAYDDELSPKGLEQVSSLCEELKEKGIETIFRSPLLRAKKTAQSLADASECSVVEVDDLRERNQYGPLTGMTKQEAREKHPDLVKQLKNHLNTLPNAESYQDASERTTRAYHQVLEKTNKCSAVVWHGGGMRVLFRDILKLGELKGIGDCSWVELNVDGDQFEIGQSVRVERED